MWTMKRIAADAANNIQVDAGCLLKNFDVTNPVAPEDEDIVCATSGDISISATPDVTDFFEDVNNAPKNCLEGKRITGWNCSVGFTCLEVTPETLKMGLGAFKTTSNGGLAPRDQYETTDFKTLYWAGDMVDTDKLFVVKIGNAVNTAGFSFTATSDGKGNMPMTLTPHYSIENPSEMPLELYVLEKADEYEYEVVTPVGTENPAEEGWYEKTGNVYVLTEDTTVDSEKTYYERVSPEGA